MAKEIIPVEQMARTIFVLREQKVLLDSQLAALYGISMVLPKRPQREIGFHVRETAPPYRTRKARR